MAKKSAAKSPWSSASDREAEREKKREAVLHAAAQAFGEKGYHRTSLDDIAERLGVTKPTLYYYARGKEELITAVAARGLEQIMEGFAGDAHACGLDQLKHLLRRYIVVTATDFGKCLVELNESDLGAELAEKIRADKRKIDRKMRSFIKLGIEDGSIAPCDARLTGFMLAGAVNGIARWYRPEGGLSPSALAEIYVNQMTNGLAPRP